MAAPLPKGGDSAVSLSESLAKVPHEILNPLQASNDQRMAQPIVRASLRATFARRARYIARFIYWTVRHRSPRHAAWVCEFEGFTWK